MTNIVQNINTLNAVEIDSFKIRIPYEYVKVINSEIIDRIGTFNADTGETIDEPEPRNFYRTYIQDERERVLYKYKWAIKKTKVELGQVRKFLHLQVNAKKLHSNYLEGITKNNIRTIYERLMSQKICSFPYKEFLKGSVTDVDFKKDVINEKFREAKLLLYEMTKEFKQAGKGVSQQDRKNNLGIWWGERESATYSYPFLKLYHKQVELCNNVKSKAFSETYLRGVDLTDRIRIEFTIKDKGHFNKLGVDDNSLITILQLDQEQKNKMLEKVIKYHLLPRPLKQVNTNPNRLTGTKLVLYQSMVMMQELSPFMTRDRIIEGMVKPMKDKSQKSKMRTKLRNIFDTYIQTMTKSKEIEQVGNLFDAMQWS